MFIHSALLAFILLYSSRGWIINENDITSLDNWIVNMTVNHDTIREYELSREYNFSKY